METLLACTVAFLEITFITVSLLLLHSLRRIIGNAPFYIALGFLLIFSQFISSAALKVNVGYLGADFYISSTVLLLPYLVALMTVYITEGTNSAQKLIVGAMATLGIYIYLSHLTVAQCSWRSFSISQGPTADSIDYILRQSQRNMAGSILALTLDLFLIPVFFQRLRNMKCRLFFAVLGALILTQFVDTIVYTTVSYWGESEWWIYMNSSYIAKFIATIWLSALITVYIAKIEKEVPGEGRSALDIVLSFFSSYSRAQRLQQHLREWEGRYQLVVENANETIMLLDGKGRILDANPITSKIFGNGEEKFRVSGKKLYELIVKDDNSEFDWGYIQGEIDSKSENKTSFSIHCIKKEENSEKTVELDFAFSKLFFEDEQMYVALGRDVTEQKRFEREKTALQEQLAHTQRLESIGQLAGGVAHDFNNYLYSIQGHLDILLYLSDIEDDEITRHIEKINGITEQASKLTQQLLGFARKGKYLQQEINLNKLIDDSIELFNPSGKQNLKLNRNIINDDVLVNGDPVQLEQVFINLLLNAGDALSNSENSDKHITITQGEATKVYDLENWDKLELIGDMEKFACIIFEDSGCGIDQDTISYIFEPFFTTKPKEKGTGMGLAMVYGTITNHGGTIQVRSMLGKGTKFYVVLPKSKD